MKKYRACPKTGFDRIAGFAFIIALLSLFTLYCVFMGAAGDPWGIFVLAVLSATVAGFIILFFSELELNNSKIVFGKDSVKMRFFGRTLREIPYSEIKHWGTVTPADKRELMIFLSKSPVTEKRERQRWYVRRKDTIIMEYRPEVFVNMKKRLSCAGYIEIPKEPEFSERLLKRLGLLKEAGTDSETKPRLRSLKFWKAVRSFAVVFSIFSVILTVVKYLLMLKDVPGSVVATHPTPGRAFWGALRYIIHLDQMSTFQEALVPVLFVGLSISIPVCELLFFGLRRHADKYVAMILPFDYSIAFINRFVNLIMSLVRANYVTVGQEAADSVLFFLTALIYVLGIVALFKFERAEREEKHDVLNNEEKYIWDFVDQES